MIAKPEILFVTPRVPYPPDKGDKIRSWRVLKHLAERYAVHLATFVDTPADYAYRDVIEDVCETAVFTRLDKRLAMMRSAGAAASGQSFSLAYYRSLAFARAVDKIRRRPLLAEIAFSSVMAPYVKTANPGVLRIVDFCDADSEKWRAYGHSMRGPLGGVYTREAIHLARAETDIANWAALSFAVSPEEAAIFNGRARARRAVEPLRNGVDGNFFDPAIVSAEPRGGDVVFVGVMNYRPNVEAVLEFLRTAWPAIRARTPHARLAIVGASPVRAIRALHGVDGVYVTGRVADVRPWLKAARVAIAPLSIGRGVQNKVLEAMAMAKPVVLTRAAATGAAVINEDTAIIADAPEDVVCAITRLLDDEAAAARLGVAARRAVQTACGWTQQLQRLDEAIERVSRFGCAPQNAIG